MSVICTPSAFPFAEERCKTTFKNLTDRYWELLYSLPSGSGSDGIKKIKWPYFKSMTFMRPILEKRG